MLEMSDDDMVCKNEEDTMTSPRSEPTFVRVADGTALAVHDLGGPHDPRAPVLLFSHATGFCGRSFGPMATELSSAYRCLAIDHRGHGLSTLAPDASLRWTTMGDDVVAVLDCGLIDPEQVVHGVGHSMGGATLVLAAAQRPGRILGFTGQPSALGQGGAKDRFAADGGE